MLKHKYKSFTVIELIVVFALLGMIALFTFPYQMNDASKSALQKEARLIVSNISHCRQNAFTGKDNLSCTIEFGSAYYIINNEQIDLSRNISISSIDLNGNASDLSFNVGDLSPSNYGSVTLTNSESSYTITINKEGLVYETKI